MPLENYGALRGTITGHKRARGHHGHYQIHISAGPERAREHFRVALNVRSRRPPSELLFLLDDNFDHPLLDHLVGMRSGFTPIRPVPDSAALDYIRGNLFNPAGMRRIPHDVPGPDNDLNDRLDYWLTRTRADPRGEAWVLGERWGPEPHARDRHFRFHPASGMHNVHMNQGNDPRYQTDDGPWQDGALLLHLPDEGRWVAGFLAFQSQSWHTDDTTGHRIPEAGPPVPPGGWATVYPREHPAPTGAVCVEARAVRIIAALVNPQGSDPGRESITLLNTQPDAVDLGGWTIIDSARRRLPLDGITLGPGATVRVPLDGATVQLSNAGGTLTLLGPDGFRVDGVAYTAGEAQREGYTVVF
ncbi:MAG: DUF2278 family protein [Nitrospirota bacterium]|nr:DUF2278 family protein [Nitrospirota bacterium]